MSIQYIENISIDGKGNSVNRTLFNGYIYRLNYNISFGESKSTITTNLVSEDGSYSIAKSDLNYSRVYPIKIGSSINVNMYLKRAKKIVDPNSKILELEFCDTSTKLDTLFVGLKKKHGLISKGNILIVGREVHPCDRDYDGEIDKLEQIENICHPCRNNSVTDARREIVNCKEITKYAIFDVVYNFTMLLKELRKNGVKIQSSIQDPNPKYFARHTGTLRDVLKSWSDDFGWSFYWEDEQVKFIDLRNTIDVAANVAQFCPNLSAFEEEWSVEDTFVTKSISSYERPGENENYTCQDAKYLRLPLYEPGGSGFSSELSITTKIKKIPAGLALYSKTLRDLYYTYDYYHLRSAEDYVLNKFMPKIGLKILSAAITLNPLQSAGGLKTGGLQGGSLEPSNGLFAPKGMPLNPDPSQSIAFLESSVPAELQAVKAAISSNLKYKMCFELLTEEEQWLVANGLARDPEDYFFFIGYYDEVLDEGHFQEEREFAENFIGKYHIYQPNLSDPLDAMFFEDTTYKEETICNQNIKINDVEVSYRALAMGNKDSFSFFNSAGATDVGDTRTLSSLDFFKWLRIARDSNEASLAPNKDRLFKLVVIRKDNAQFYPSPSAAQDVDPEDTEKPKDNIKNSALIQEAQKGAIIRIEKKNNSQGEFIPRKVTDDGIDKNIDRSKVFVFIGRKVDRDDYRVVTNNSLNNANLLGSLYDGKPLYFSYGEATDTFQNDKGEVFYEYPDFKCLPVGNENNLCFKRNFHTPVGTFSYYEPTYSLYGIVIEKSKTIKKKHEKIQNVFVDGDNPDSQTSRLEVNYRNISDDDINIYENTPNNKCRYNLKKIKELHERFAKNLNIKQNKPSVNKTFTVEGIDINGSPKISDGLLSVSISLEEDGVRTTYSFGNRTKKPLAEDFLKAQDLSSNQTRIYSIPIPPRKTNTL